MAQVDTSIYGNIGRGVKSVAELGQEYAQVDAARLTQQANKLQLVAAQQAAQDDQAARSAYMAAGTDGNKLLTELQGRGLYKQYGVAQKQQADLAKAQADQRKVQLENGVKQMEAMGQLLSGVNSPETYAAARMRAGELFGPQALQGVPDTYDPAFVATKLREAVTVKDRLEQEHKQLTLAETVRNNIQTDATSRRNNDQTNATSRANNAASVGATIRGQNMTDARAKELQTQTLTKPFEVTGPDGKPMLVQQDRQGNIKPVADMLPKGGGKPLTDTQGKALLFGARMQAAEEVLSELDKQGVRASIPGSRTPVVGDVINAIQPETRQRLDQAKRDFINAVLRRESGAVISDAEFANAERQYFPQPGESAGAREQKKRNRELATRGILAEVPDAEKRVSQVRGPAPTAAGGGFKILSVE